MSPVQDWQCIDVELFSLGENFPGLLVEARYQFIFR